MTSKLSHRALLGASLAAVALGACNAIFGIEPGEPRAAGSTGTGGAVPTSSSSGTGGATSTSTSTTSTGSSATSTGAGPACGADAGVSTGTPERLKASFSQNDDEATAAAWGGDGNLVVAGLFAGPTLTLGQTLGHTGTAGALDAYVIKYDDKGAYLWGKAFGGTKDVRANAVGLDGAGNIYLAGSMAGSAQFGGTPPLDAPSDPGSDYSDLFVAKLDPSGNVLWAKSFGNLYTQRGQRLAMDSKGSVYVAGTSYDKVDFGTGQGSIGDTLDWWSFLVKLDTSGKPLWAQAHTAWDSDLTPDYQEYFEAAVAVDPSDDVIWGGNFKDQDFFGNDLVPPLGGTDAFVVKLHGDKGDLVWHRFFHQKGDSDAGLDGDQWVTALGVDPCSGDVYAAGGLTQGIQFDGLPGAKVTIGDPGDPDMFLVKMAAKDGQPIWAKTYGDSGLQEATSIAVTPGGDVLLAGFLLDSAGYQGVDFGPGIGVLKAAAPEPGPDYYSDAFVIELDSSGKGLWGKRIGDQLTQQAYAVAASRSGDVALAGVFYGSISIGGGVPSYDSADYDTFIGWFGP